MPDPHDHKDDDTTPIKPMMLTGVVLLSAGAGLAAGLLICWLFTCHADEGDGRQATDYSIESTDDASRVALLTME